MWRKKNSLWKKGLSDYSTTNACILDEQTEKKLVIDRIFYKTSKFKMKFTKKKYDLILNKIFDFFVVVNEQNTKAI